MQFFNIHIYIDIIKLKKLNNCLRTSVIVRMWKIHVISIVDQFKPKIIDNDKAKFKWVLVVNVTKVFLGIKHVTQVMILAHANGIIFTTNVSLIIRNSGPHPYCCSKHIVVKLTKNAVVELSQVRIRVSSLSPYAMATSIWLMMNQEMWMAKFWL